MGGNRIDYFRDNKMAAPGSIERSRASSLVFRSPCSWLRSVVPPRRQSRQIPAPSLAPYRPCYIHVQSFASLSFLHSLHLPPWRLIFLRCSPRRERSQIVALRQSTKNQVNRQSEDGVPCPEDDCSTAALLCSLISASQLTYLLINLHSTFYYRGRQRLAQIFVSLSQRQRIRAQQRRPRRFWIRPRRTCVWWDNFMDDVVWMMSLCHRNGRRTSGCARKISWSCVQRYDLYWEASY